jgi:hypothetical protein
MTTPPKAGAAGSQGSAPYTPPVQYLACQCEHSAHFSRTVRTPAGACGHKYMAQFPDVEITMTPRGRFYLCRDCREDCHG